MKLILIALIVLITSGCAAGPIRVTHSDGEMPKIHVNMPSENLHLRLRHHDEVELSWVKEF